MDLLKLRALRGPNYYSISNTKLVVLRVNLGHRSQQSTADDPEFVARLDGALRLEGHLLDQVEAGVSYARLLEIVCLELQFFSGMNVTFSRSVPTASSDIWNVVVSYEEEEAGLFAAEKAVRLLQLVADPDESVEALQADVRAWTQRLREIRDRTRFGPSTEALISEAARRGIPHLRLNSESLVQLGYGRHQQRISASITEATRVIAVDLAGNKFATKRLLEDMSIPVPSGRTISDAEELDPCLDRLGFPVAIKPLDANQGRGITVNVRSREQALEAFAKAREISKRVIVEQSLQGNDYRALVVNNRLVAVARREPAHVVGDGEHTITELVELANRDPRRGFGHENVMTRIELDAASLSLLAGRGQGLETVLAAGEHCSLKTTANLSTGGTATDVTDEVHPFNSFLFERIAHLVGLDVSGIDVIAPDLRTPLNENGGGIIEVNAAPGLRMHLSPSDGRPRNVAEPIIDMLFPPGTPARIPIVAVTGTNGKTTTTRLIAHLIKNTGKLVGYTTSEGVYIGNYLISRGDYTGPLSAQMVLKDPKVEVAVLETARGGMLRAGLGFDRCDIGVLTNISPDHLGLGDIDTVDDLAKLKAVVPESATGHAVLNADDERVMAIASSLRCPLALFSLQPDNPHLRDLPADGVACLVENDWVVIRKGDWTLPVERVVNIPITYSGRAVFNLQNAMAAALAAFCHGLKVDEIRVGLTTFTPSVAQTPGRMNLIPLNGYSVLIDYAHNTAGMEAIAGFLQTHPASRRTAVIGGTGDRRDDDIVALGRLTAQLFDRAILREDEDLRGRAPGEVPELLRQGLEGHRHDYPWELVSDSRSAIRQALDQAQAGELVAILGGDIQHAIDISGEYSQRLLSHP